MSGHVYCVIENRFYLFYWTLELFRQCSIPPHTHTILLTFREVIPETRRSLLFKLDIHDFIAITGLISLLVDDIPRVLSPQ
jgi:hypothetical protein